MKITSIPSKVIKAVIFDFDGTIVDSERIFYLSDKEILKNYGINLTYQMKKKYIGGSAYDMMKDIKERYQIEDSVETLVEKKDNNYIKVAEKKIKIFPKMYQLLKILKQKDYMLAIASGSSRIILTTLLTKLNIIDYFNIIISSNEVNKGKPAPDIFIETAKRLKIPCENTVVVEDSQYGVEAAKNACMYCVAIPYIIDKPLPERYLKADMLFERGMKEFNSQKVALWIEGQYQTILKK